MRFILDTHAFLWFVAGDERLSAKARQLVEDSDNQPLLSIANLWEMAIKVSIGKLTLDPPLPIFIPQHLQINGIQTLSIEFQHTVRVTELPFHHRDPFDRLLVAQALTEDVPLVSADPVFGSYGVRCLW